MGKKTFAVALILLVTFMTVSFLNLIHSDNRMGGGVETESIHSDAFQEMPKSSQQDYYFKEKVFLQQLQSAGHVLDNYYLAFSTSKITQADIDNRYDEYDTDMGNFDAEILKTKKKIGELRPATLEAQAHQRDTLDKLNYLEQQVSEYQEHEFSAKDTYTYLAECRQALGRLFAQGKMEF